MEGGADTGFRHVEPEKYKTRLLQVFGKGKNLAIREVNFWLTSRQSLKVKALSCICFDSLHKLTNMLVIHVRICKPSTGFRYMKPEKNISSPRVGAIIVFVNQSIVIEIACVFSYFEALDTSYKLPCFQ